MTEKTVYIRRAKHSADNPYFLHLRALAQDRSLSWEARGVMGYILSKPDDWKVQPKDLEQECARQKVYSILKELKAAGYIVQEQRQGKNGRFEPGDYIVYEQPCDEKPHTARPHTVQPDTVNQHITESRVSQTTDSRITEKTPAPGGAAASPSQIEGSGRKQNPLFNAVALYIFEIDPKHVEDDGGRIGGIAAWLSKSIDRMTYGKSKKIVVKGFISEPAKPEHVRRFAVWWKANYPKANLPLGFEQFVDGWRKWATQQQKNSSRSTENDVVLTKIGGANGQSV